MLFTKFGVQFESKAVERVINDIIWGKNNSKFILSPFPNIDNSLKFIKRLKKIGDNAPLLEMRNQRYGITLIGDQFVKIGEFQITLIAEFQ